MLRHQRNRPPHAEEDGRFTALRSARSPLSERGQTVHLLNEVHLQL